MVAETQMCLFSSREKNDEPKNSRRKRPIKNSSLQDLGTPEKPAIALEPFISCGCKMLYSKLSYLIIFNLIQNFEAFNDVQWSSKMEWKYVCHTTKKRSS